MAVKWIAHYVNIKDPGDISVVEIIDVRALAVDSRAGDERIEPAVVGECGGQG